MFCVAAMIGAYICVPLFYDLMKASFDRTKLTTILANKLGRSRISDTATDEVMLISYAYDE